MCTHVRQHDQRERAAAMAAFASYKESDLTPHFMGRWQLHEIDAYDTHKAGTQTRQFTVRSVVRQDGLHLISRVPRFTYDFVLNGNRGISSEIVDEFYNDAIRKKQTRIFIAAQSVLPRDALRQLKPAAGGLHTLDTKAEFADTILNLHDTYTVPLTYFVEKTGAGYCLRALRVILPIQKYNAVIANRRLRLVDYQGAAPVHMEPRRSTRCKTREQCNMQRKRQRQ